MKKYFTTTIFLSLTLGLFGQHSLLPDYKVQRQFDIFKHNMPIINNPGKRLTSFFQNTYGHQDTMSFYYPSPNDSLYTVYNTITKTSANSTWFSKDSLEYDEYGRITNQITHVLYDSTKIVSHTVFDDTANSETIYINHYKNGLQQSIKVVKLKNDIGSPKNTKQYILDNNLVWVLAKETKYTQSGLILSQEEISSNRTLYTYDANELLLSKTHQSWENGAYKAYNRLINTIDNGNIAKSESQVWDDNNQAWNTNEILILTYNLNGQLKTCLSSHYYSGYSVTTHSEYLFNADNQLFKVNYKELDTLIQPPIWRNAGQANYWYKNGVLDSFNRVYLNFSGDTLAGKIIDVTFNPSKTILAVTKYRLTNGTWGIDEAARWYYEDVLTDSKFPISQPELSVFCKPNPADNYIKILLNGSIANFHLYIFSPSGKQFFSKKIKNDTQIDITDFPKGLYFYTVFGKGFITRGKFIKQ